MTEVGLGEYWKEKLSNGKALVLLSNHGTQLPPVVSLSRTFGVPEAVARLCVLLLGFWVIASSVLMPVPAMADNQPMAHSVQRVQIDVSFPEAAANGKAQAMEQSTLHGNCCEEPECVETGDCSMPCASSCPAPMIAVLADFANDGILAGGNRPVGEPDNGFLQTVNSALFRPPIA